MELDSLELKNFYNSFRMAAVWIWRGWTSLSKIFLAAWMELVTMMILETLFMEQAWFMLHLIANNSASVVVMKDAWWTVLISGWFAEWICEIDVAMLFLMLASVITIAKWGDEEFHKTISSSSWAQVFLGFLSFSLLTKLKEKRLEKLSIMRQPGKNSGSRGEKDGKIPYNLMLESIRWPLVKALWWLVNEPMLCELGDFDWGGESSKRFFKMWLSGSLKEQIWDLFTILWRWNRMGIMPMKASIPSKGEVLNTPKI